MLYCWGDFYGRSKEMRKTIYLPYKTKIDGVAMNSSRKKIKDTLKEKLSAVYSNYKDIRTFFFSSKKPRDWDEENKTKEETEEVEETEDTGDVSK